jgi:hypothetical protein
LNNHSKNIDNTEGLRIYDDFGLENMVIYIEKLDSVNDINYYGVKYTLSSKCLSGSDIITKDFDCVSRSILFNNYVVGIYNKKPDNNLHLILASSNFIDVNKDQVLNNLKRSKHNLDSAALTTIKYYYPFLHFKKLALLKKNKSTWYYQGLIGNDSSPIPYKDLSCTIQLKLKRNLIQIRTGEKDSWLYYAVKKYKL